MYSSFQILIDFPISLIINYFNLKVKYLLLFGEKNCLSVFPKRLITFNPMKYVVWRGKKEEYELFSDEDGETASTPTLSYEQYQRLEDFLKKKNNPALLPIQIAYYTGLRIGEVCALTWQDINLE